MPFWVSGRRMDSGQPGRHFSHSTDANAARLEAFHLGLTPERVVEATSAESPSLDPRTLDERVRHLEIQLSRFRARNTVGNLLLVCGQVLCVLSATAVVILALRGVVQFLDAKKQLSSATTLDVLLVFLGPVVAVAWCAALYVVFARARRLPPAE